MNPDAGTEGSPADVNDSATAADPLGHLGPVHRWIVLHDRSVVFALLYVSLTIFLSVYVSYFWLVALVGLHLVLEWLKKGYLGYGGGWHRTAWTIWDTKFDIALVFLALTLLSYTGVGAGVAGAQSASRVGLLGGRLSALSARVSPILARFARAGVVLRAMGIRAVDLFFSARVILFRKADMARASKEEAFLEQNRSASEDDEVPEISGKIPAHLPWQRALGGYGWFAIMLVVVNTIAVFAAPVVTEHTYPSLLDALAAKLHPWP
ncbi:MAG: hypothetical protein EA347_11625 [Thioalkalivibrio sp.]|nr:MAG: hypothetical protein EA347_11625 [Thioalkalivibrio sp.]